MKIRLITGTCYIAVLLVFFLLKIFVSDLFFDALIYAFALIGTFEMTRAMGERITRAEKAVVFVFAAACIPACALCEEFLGGGVEAAAICFFAAAVALLSLLVARHEETTPENLGVALSLRGLSHSSPLPALPRQPHRGERGAFRVCRQFRPGDFVHLRHFSVRRFPGIRVRSVSEGQIPQKDGARRQPQQNGGGRHRRAGRRAGRCGDFVFCL